MKKESAKALGMVDIRNEKQHSHESRLLSNWQLTLKYR
jgi:hypothetical protein